MENKYGIYVRVSTAEQKKEGLSPEIQEKKCKQYIDLKDGKLHKVYKDIGKSGGKIKGRNDFQEMYKDCMQGILTHIVFVKLDRIGRNARDILNISHDLSEKKIKIVSLDGSIDTSGSYGKFQLVLLAGLAELERNITKDRTEVVHIDKVEQGYPCTNPPFGYVWKYPKGTKGTKKINEWIIDPKKALTVIKIFSRFSVHTPVSDIAKECRVSRHAVYHIVKNVAYLGFINYKNKIYEGKHYPIVSQELWKKIYKEIPKVT